MVPGHDSCSCPTCHVVCAGRFPDCAGVWARGPREISLRRGRSLDRAAPAKTGKSPVATNGSASSPLALGPAPAANSNGHDADPPATGAILAEVRALARGIEALRTTTAAPAATDTLDDVRSAVRELSNELQTLPDRLAMAISRALKKQHELIISDVRSMFDEFQGPDDRT